MDISKAKGVYVLSRANLTKFQNLGVSSCPRCEKKFEELDVIATSATGNRYCYRCASEINLVSGILSNDLEIESMLADTCRYATSLSQDLGFSDVTKNMTLGIIERAFTKLLIPSKNTIGLASAAAYLAYQISHETPASYDDFPVSAAVLRKNLTTLRTCLASFKDA